MRFQVTPCEFRLAYMYTSLHIRTYASSIRYSRMKFAFSGSVKVRLTIVRVVYGQYHRRQGPWVSIRASVSASRAKGRYVQHIN